MQKVMTSDFKYFQDEIREGFYIPGMTKRSWAAQMQVLKVVVRICEENNIKWFADCGTLIGTIRHGGFIPWDDDLDICMLRDDFERFNQVIKTQLPKEYVILNLENVANYDNFLTRIVNTNGIDIGIDFLNNNQGFPYTAGVDVFPLDYLFEDEEKEKDRRSRAAELWLLSYEFVDKNFKISDRDLDVKLMSVAGICPDHKFPQRTRALMALEHLLTACKEKTSRVALMPMYVPNGHHIYPISYFEQTVKMPFEDMTINVPAAYADVLRIEYGNWYIASKKGGIHNYPFYKEQQQMLIDEKNSAPYLFICDAQLADDICFGAKRNEIISARENHANSCDPIRQLLGSLSELHRHIEMYVSQDIDAYQDAMSLLMNCQDAAIAIGTAIENEQGEGHPTVALLEQYCEKIFEFYTFLSDVVEETVGIAESSNVEVTIQSEINDINQQLELIVDSYIKDGKKRKIIFLPTNTSEWKGMNTLYLQMSQDTQNDIYVMPVPYAERDHNGNPVGNAEIDDDLLTHIDPSIAILDFRKFDFTHNHPYSFIIADPFDEYESAKTVLPFFYSENLAKYCDELIFCHTYDLDDIESEDLKSLENVKRIVKSPGVMYSDLVYVPNENMRDVYIQVLKELYESDGDVSVNKANNDDSLVKNECATDEALEEISYWNQKIRIVDLNEIIEDSEQTEDSEETPKSNAESNVMPGNNVPRKKRMLFYTSISDIYTYKDKAMEWIEDSLKTFAGSNEKVDVIWIREDELKDNIKKVFPDGIERFTDVEKQFTTNGGVIATYEESISEIQKADAFYGSAGYFMNLCVRRKIPIMVRRDLNN